MKSYGSLLLAVASVNIVAGQLCKLSCLFHLMFYDALVHAVNIIDYCVQYLHALFVFLHSVYLLP